jgi:hypothetical protein
MLHPIRGNVHGYPELLTAAGEVVPPLRPATTAFTAARQPRMAPQPSRATVGGVLLSSSLSPAIMLGLGCPIYRAVDVA